MKKVKFFMSLFKERDWLEQMAKDGWLLTNMNLGVIYHFQKVSPCDKVFEIERFGLSSHPTIQEVNARKIALDIALQSGWEVVTHDEDMNYYFMKDKEGDETDEFYDDESLRKERAERFRKRYGYEFPLLLIKQDIILSVIYSALFLFLLLFRPGIKATLPLVLGLLFALITAFDVFFNHFYMKWGQRIYEELCMNREEWQNHITSGEKKRFAKVHQLLSYLQEKNNSGLVLSGYQNQKYQFEKDCQAYDYFIDTKSALKSRSKKQGTRFTDEKKDFTLQGLKWFETSIAQAAEYGLKPIAIIKNRTIIFRRPHSDLPLPPMDGNKSISRVTPSLLAVIIIICTFLIGYCIGNIAAYFIL